MEGSNGTSGVQRPRDYQHNPLDALQGRQDMRQPRSARSPFAQALEALGNRGSAGANPPAGATDKRKWDYRRCGYADKPYIPRDYSKPISRELQSFYGEQKD